MKKSLLLIAAFMVSCISMFAADLKFYEPDEVYTSGIANLVGKSIAIINTTDKSALAGSDAQNVAYKAYDKILRSDVAVLQYKIEADGDNYMFRCVTPAGGDYSLWGSSICYLNCQPDGRDNVIFNLGNGTQKGTDCENGGVWIVAEVEGGFTIQSLASKKYLGKSNIRSEEPVVFQFATLKEVVKENNIAAGKYDATDAKVLKEAGVVKEDVVLSWESGMDYDSYRYIVITLGQNTMESSAVGQISLKDADGNVVKGDDYGVSYQNMWFGSWNHQFTCCMDLEKLRVEKMFNLHKITELSIGVSEPGVILNSIYATNQEAKTINRWGNPNDEGTYRNAADGLAAGTYGTVCLPYEASYAGASVYQICGASDKYIQLEQITGLMEAGKSYFYCLNAPLNPTHPDAKVRAFFYKASTAEDVASPIENNGLIGTFTDNGNVPEGSLVLSKNALWTVDSEIAFAANHAYVNPKNIKNTSKKEAKVIAIATDEATAIKSASASLNETSAIYSSNGALQNGLKKGINIVKMANGEVKKVLVK